MSVNENLSEELAVESAGEDAEGFVSIVKPVNKSSNYTPGMHIFIASKIRELNMYKPVAVDSVWNLLSNELNRQPKVLFSHWNAILGHIKCARSTLGRPFPAEIAGQGEIDHYFRDLYQKMIESPKGFGAKGWWSLELLTLVCEMQLQDERAKGFDKKQDATSLEDLALKATNKHDAEQKLRRQQMEDKKKQDEAKLAEKESKKENWQRGLLETISQAAAAMTSVASSSSSSSSSSGSVSVLSPQIVDLTEDVYDLKDRMVGLENEVKDMKNEVKDVKSGVSEILSLLKKRGLPE